MSEIHAFDTDGNGWTDACSVDADHDGYIETYAYDAVVRPGDVTPAATAVPARPARPPGARRAPDDRPTLLRSAVPAPRRRPPARPRPRTSGGAAVNGRCSRGASGATRRPGRSAPAAVRTPQTPYPRVTPPPASG